MLVLSARGLLGPVRAAASYARVGLRPTGRVGPTRRGHANPRRALCAYPPLPRERNRPPRAQARATNAQHDAWQSPSAFRAKRGLPAHEWMLKRPAQRDPNAPSARLDVFGWGGHGAGVPLCERRRGGYEARVRLGLAYPRFVGPTRLVARIAVDSGDASVAARRLHGHPNPARQPQGTHRRQAQ